MGGAQEARALAREIEAEGVSIRYCKVCEVPVIGLLGFFMLISVPLPSILLDVYIAENSDALAP